MELHVRLTPKPVFSAIVFVALAVGGIAYATIPDSTGVIYGCYGKNGLRVIDPSTGDACRTTETAVNWNQQGVQGLKGDKGDPGTSVTSETVAAGTACAQGGSKFTAASNVTFACNGAPGAKGEPGDPASTHVYAQWNSVARALSPSLIVPTIAAEVAVPRPGAYLVTFRGAFRGIWLGQNATTFVQCDIVVPDHPTQRLWDEARVRASVVGGDSFDTLVMHAAVSVVPSGSGFIEPTAKIQALCWGFGAPGGTDISGVQLTALSVGGIN